ncbi:alpha/beta hydrolase family protein [Wenyingzhuangia sp. IMCC45574]
MTLKKRVSFITLFIIPIVAVFSQQILGDWNGKVKKGNESVTFIFKIKQEKANYDATLDIPFYGISGIKATNTTYSNGKLMIENSSMGIQYVGIFNKEKQLFEGTFKEGKLKFALNLAKGIVKNENFRKPQDPIKPYPYYEEEVLFENKSAGVSIAGTLTLPSKKGKFPVVILISGSGPQDRNESLMGHKPFLVLADHLTKQGIAVLRYDDRGVGKSTGNFEAATTEDFSKDVLSAISYLKTRKNIDSKKIGLIGHSEGGIIAPLAANNSKDVAFIVLLASTGILGAELSVIQSRTLRPFPVNDEIAYEKNTRKAIEIITSDKSQTEIKEELTQHYNQYLRPILSSLNTDEKNINIYIENLVKTNLQPWLRFFVQYNPADEIEKLQIPVLSLNGSKDTQVNAKLNQEAIKNALIKAGNKDFKIMELENLNHFFQECKTGEVKEYRKIKQTFSPLALEQISSWILKRV